MIEKIKLFYFIRKKQSLKYQIMIILMEEHLKARLDYDSICTYDGGNEIWFDKQAWDKMKNKICKYITKNYKKKFNYFDDDYIIGLFSDEEEFCRLDKNNIYNQNDDINITDNITDNTTEKDKEHHHNNSDIFKITFLMKDKGYSYQYNNYQRSGNKLQKRANQFILITLMYYLLSWLIKDPIVVFKTLFEKVLKIMSLIRINFEIIPTILVVIFILAILKKIFDNK